MEMIIEYEFTTKHVLYYEGKAVLFNVGDRLQLAGLELSKHTPNSPFHFRDDIVRIPNAVLTLKSQLREPNLSEQLKELK